MFRIEVEAPTGFRRDDEATRVLRDFEIVLRDAGAETKRRGTSLTFRGGLLTGRWSGTYRWSHSGGAVTWFDATDTVPPRFVLTGTIWAELLAVLVIGVVALIIEQSLLLFGLLVAIGGGVPTLVATARVLWLRGRLAAIVNSAGRRRKI